MAPGARSKFGAPIFEPEVFRKQMYCIEEITCVTLLGLFSALSAHSAPPTMIWRPAPGVLCPRALPRYAPDLNAKPMV